MTILAVDPGSHRTGWATETESGVMLEPTAAAIWRAVQDIGPSLLVVEGQFNLQRSLDVVRIRFYWECCARIIGAKVVVVQPATWQSSFGIKVPKEFRGPKNASKRQRWVKATIMARAMGLAVDRNEPPPVADQADALCIHAWARDAEKLGVLG